MEPRLTRSEYWLLGTVVDSGRPLPYLQKSGTDWVFNRPSPGVGRVSLLDTLERLFNMGLIGAATMREGGYSGPFNRLLTRAEIESAIDEPPDDVLDISYYGLTPEGGRQWEAFAVPDWGRFVECHERPPRSGKWAIGVLISLDQARLERLLEGARYMGQAVDHKHVHRRVIRPWQVTYWKRLQHGHRVFYRFDEVEYEFDNNPHWFMKIFENRQWCRWV